MRFSIKMIALGLLWAVSASAFSPYENYLLSGKERHVMLIAAAQKANVDAVQAALKTLNEKSAAKAFKKKGITNLCSFTKVLQDKTYFMVYFDYAGDAYLEAAKDFESVKITKALSPLLEAHPRAKQDGTTWLQMEWINYIYGAKPTDKKPIKIGQATRVRPDREDYYRTIHQTVWPGVVDNMVRAGNHDFSIFFVELGDELYQFYYVESYATDAQNEKMKTYKDPTVDRWINVAGPCLDPLPGAVNYWTRMEQVSE